MSPLKKASSVDGLRAAAAGRTSPVAAPVSIPGSQAVNVKPVRLNLDIDRDTHRWLKGFALDADSDVAHVVRALLAELQADDALADKVRARVAVTSGKLNRSSLNGG